MTPQVHTVQLIAQIADRGAIQRRVETVLGVQFKGVLLQRSAHLLRLSLLHVHAVTCVVSEGCHKVCLMRLVLVSIALPGKL